MATKTKTVITITREPDEAELRTFDLLTSDKVVTDSLGERFKETCSELFDEPIENIDVMFEKVEEDD